MLNPSATLLIIDDDEVVRVRLASYLEAKGFQLLQAPSGAQALELLDSGKPDLLICDLRMSDMSGLDLIRQLRAQGSETPVILLSDSGSTTDAVQSLRLGAADYLIKPLDDLAVREHSILRVLDDSTLRL